MWEYLLIFREKMYTCIQCYVRISWMHYRHLHSARHWIYKAQQGKSHLCLLHFFKYLITLDYLFICKREAAKYWLGLIYLAGAYSLWDIIKMVSKFFHPDVSFCRFLFWNNSQKEDLSTSCLEGVTLAFSILHLGKQRAPECHWLLCI